MDLEIVIGPKSATIEEKKKGDESERKLTLTF